MVSIHDTRVTEIMLLRQGIISLVAGIALLSYAACDCTVGNIEHGNSRASPEVAEGEQLYWQCDFDYFHYPGNGESVCRNGALVPAPECRPIQYGPAGCPAEMWGKRVTRRENTCYIIYPNEMRHDAAKVDCRLTYHGRLLTINNRSTMDYIASVLDHQGWAKNCWCLGCCLFRGGKKVWIGLYYTDTWRWDTLRWAELEGASTPYTNWKEGEGGTWINGRKYERCATLDGGYMWKWDDVDCDDSHYVVCETEASDIE